MGELLTKTAAELAKGIKAKEYSSVEVTEAFLDRIAQVDEKVNAFVSVDRDEAVKQAQLVDKRLADGETLSVLAGVPIGLKDLFCYNKLPTTASSKMLQNWVPPYNSTVTEKLLDAGLVVLGKTNLDEFAMGSSTETSYFGVTHNPWDFNRVPGGSGGGSAAAVAAFETPLAVGTDTGGSIRQPAAVTGTVGVKPTYGGVSRYGVIALASSLDQPGPCARNVLDAALLHSVMAGYDPMDSTSINLPTPDVVSAAKHADVSGMKIGVVKEFHGEGYDAGVEDRCNEAIELLKAGGAEIIEVSCPHFLAAMAAYYLIMPAEISSNIARYDGVRYGLRSGDDGTHTAAEMMKITREDGFGAETKRRIILGTYALSAGYYDAYYGSAQKVRTLVREDFTKAFEICDVLISPATPTVAFKIGERTNDPMAMYRADLCTIPSNLAGIAAGSFPVGLADGLPVGLQVMAPVMEDPRVYQVGAYLEHVLQSAWGGTLLDQINPVEGKLSGE